MEETEYAYRILGVRGSRLKNVNFKDWEIHRKITLRRFLRGDAVETVLGSFPTVGTGTSSDEYLRSAAALCLVKCLC
jgi:hypothetical protein